MSQEGRSEKCQKCVRHYLNDPKSQDKILENLKLDFVFGAELSFWQAISQTATNQINKIVQLGGNPIKD